MDRVLRVLNRLTRRKGSGLVAYREYRRVPGATHFAENVWDVMNIALSEAFSLTQRPVRPEHLFLACLRVLELTTPGYAESLGVGWREVKEWAAFNIAKAPPCPPYRETCYRISQREDGIRVTHHDTTDMSIESHDLVHTIMVEARRQGNKRVSVKVIFLTLLDSVEVQRCLLDIGRDLAKVREAVTGLGDG